MSDRCLNCDTPLRGSFCHHCGQKSSTHRITFASFIQHDLVHGIFHLDKGVLYTLKSLLYSPGYAAKSFIAGKRVLHYNIFALFIIVIALKTLVDMQVAPGDLFESSAKVQRQSDEILNQGIHHYYKLIYLLIIPLLSAFSFLFFKRLKFNYTEHIVLNAFLLAGGFFYALIFSVVEYLTGIEDLRIYGLFLIAIYTMLGYFQVTRADYSFFAYLIRALSVVLLFIGSLLIVLTAIVIIFYDGQFEGTIRLQ